MVGVPEVFNRIYCRASSFVKSEDSQMCSNTLTKKGLGEYLTFFKITKLDARQYRIASNLLSDLGIKIYLSLYYFKDRISQVNKLTINMTFTNHDKSLSLKEIEQVEKSIGINFPEPLRQFFQKNNGAEPDPYVLKTDSLDTIVSETIPLLSGKGRGTAENSYNRLIRQRSLVDEKYFPFAVDGGGDYFFVNCEDQRASVYFYRSDSFSPSSLVKVSESLEDFWQMLTQEEDECI